MGITGSGKSSFIKEVTGQQDIEVGSGISSTTIRVAIYPTIIDGHEVLLVDTPGFDDSSRNEGQILQAITNELARLYVDRIPLSGVIYLHDITAERLGGSAQRYLKMFTEIVGTNALRNVTLLTTKWDRMPMAYNVTKETQLKEGPWKCLIRGNATVRRISQADGHDAYIAIVKEVLKNVATTLLIQSQLVNEGRPLNETDAGRMLDEQIREATEHLRNELKEVNDALADTKAQYGKQMNDLRAGLEEDKRDLEQRVQQADEARKALQVRFETAQAEEERKFQARLQQALQDQQRQQAQELERVRQEAQQEAQRQQEARRQEEAQRQQAQRLDAQRQEAQRQEAIQEQAKASEYSSLENRAVACFRQGLMRQTQELYWQAYQVALGAWGPQDGRTSLAMTNAQSAGSYVGSYVDKGPGGMYYSREREVAWGQYDDDDDDDDY